MAAGKACIGTRAGGIPEAVADGETGLIVPTHDPAALAQAIVRLLQTNRDAGAWAKPAARAPRSSSA